VPHVGFQALCISFDVAGGGLVGLGLGELEKLAGIGDAFGDAVDLGEVGAQAGALAPELLRPRRIRPDGRVLQLAGNLLEALLLLVVLKETPVAR